VRGFARTFGEAAPNGGFGALAFFCHIPHLPVTPAVRPHLFNPNIKNKNFGFWQAGVFFMLEVSG
jgi:hypothetical protein